MTIHLCEQRSPEWHLLRSGKFTASDFGDLMPSSKQGMGDWNKTQLNIIYRVAAERMTGHSCPSTFTSAAMQHGIDTEDTARLAYELETGHSVEQVGFIEMNEFIGCSPDGLVPLPLESMPGDELGGLEIKCPNSDTHLRYFNNRDDLVSDYKWQCYGGMMCSGRGWWDLYSFDDRFENPALQSVRIRILRDEREIQQLAERLGHAEAKVKEITGGKA